MLNCQFVAYGIKYNNATIASRHECQNYMFLKEWDMYGVRILASLDNISYLKEKLLYNRKKEKKIKLNCMRKRNIFCIFSSYLLFKLQLLISVVVSKLFELKFTEGPFIPIYISSFTFLFYDLKIFFF